LKKTFALKSKSKDNIKAIEIRSTTQIEIGIMITSTEEILEGSVILIQDKNDKNGWHVMGIKKLAEEEIDDELSNPEDIDMLRQQISKDLAKLIKTNRTQSMVWNMAKIDSKKPYII
jgi:hypothetical protein